MLEKKTAQIIQLIKMNMRTTLVQNTPIQYMKINTASRLELNSYTVTVPILRLKKSFASLVTSSHSLHHLAHSIYMMTIHQLTPAQKTKNCAEIHGEISTPMLEKYADARFRPSSIMLMNIKLMTQ